MKKVVKDNIESLENALKEYNELLSKNTKLQSKKETMIPTLSIDNIMVHILLFHDVANLN